MRNALRSTSWTAESGGIVENDIPRFDVSKGSWRWVNGTIDMAQNLCCERGLFRDWWLREAKRRKVDGEFAESKEKG
jgi:hypothetical protein